MKKILFVAALGTLISSTAFAAVRDIQPTKRLDVIVQPRYFSTIDPFGLTANYSGGGVDVFLGKIKGVDIGFTVGKTSLDQVTMKTGALVLKKSDLTNVRGVGMSVAFDVGAGEQEFTKWTWNKLGVVGGLNIDFTKKITDELSVYAGLNLRGGIGVGSSTEFTKFAGVGYTAGCVVSL